MTAMQNLDREQRRELANKLLACPIIQPQEGFNSIICELPNQIKQAIGDLSKKQAKAAMLHIIDTCLNYENGLEKFLRAVEYFDEDTLAWAEVRKYLDSIFNPDPTRVFDPLDPDLLLMYNIEFHQQVKEVLSIQGLNPSDEETILSNFYIAEKDDEGFGILTLYNEINQITEPYITKIIPFLKIQLESLHRIRIVSCTLLSLTQQNQLKVGVGSKFLSFRTYRKILDELIPGLDVFLNYWKYEFEEAPRVSESPPITLKQVYTPVHAEKRLYKEETKTKDRRFDLLNNSENENKFYKDAQTGEFYKVAWSASLQTLVTDWLEAKDRSRLALLGGYGTGKSTFCLNLVATLANTYQSGKTNRIPLYIQLRKLAEGLPDIRRIAEFIGDISRKSSPSIEALKKLGEQHRLLFILDGFDEMAVQADEITVRRNIILFEELAKISGNKVLLVTRTEYFVKHQEEAEILQNYERLYMKPYTSTEVLDYLGKRFGLEQAAKDWEWLKPIHDLPDLATRPIFLAMISQTLPELRKLEVINRPKLYLTYLKNELGRQHYNKERIDLRIDDDKRFRMDQEIALHLYRTGKFQEGLDENEIFDLFRHSDLLTPEECRHLSRLIREIVSCSFLINPFPGKFYFSHRSFMEYFLAESLYRQLQNGQKSYFELYDLYEVAALTLEFLAELLPSPTFENNNLKEPPLLLTVRQWLEEITAVNNENGEVTWGNLQKNLSGLLLAYHVLRLPPEQLSPYVTQAEYQLFLDQEMTKKSYYQPAHWQYYRFMPQQALMPLRGVSYRHAFWFTNWLTDRFKNSYNYELPKKGLSLTNPVETLGNWTKEGELIGLAEPIRAVLEEGLNIAINFADLNFAFALELDLARAFALELDLARAFESALKFEDGLARDFELALAFGSILGLSRDFDLVRRRNLAWPITLARAIALGLDRAQDRILRNMRAKVIFEKLRENDLETALVTTLKGMQTSTRRADQLAYLLISDLLQIQMTTSCAELGSLHRNFVQDCAQILLEGYILLEEKEWQPDKYSDRKAIMLRLQGWVKMIEARINGELPAWEGIRYVRVPKEQKEGEGA